MEGWGEKAYNCNCITINIKKKKKNGRRLGGKGEQEVPTQVCSGGSRAPELRLDTRPPTRRGPWGTQSECSPTSRR